MKIALATYPNINQNVGGINLRLQRTIRYLNQRGVDVTYFDYRYDDLGKYDLLHIFKLHHSTLELTNAAEARGLPCVVSSILPPRLPVAKWRIARMLWAIGLCRGTFAFALYQQAHIASRIIAVSVAERQMIREVLGIPCNKIDVITNCSDETIFDGKDIEGFRRTHRLEKYAICVGRVEPNKNQLNLLKAAAGLDIAVVIVGRPGEAALDYYQACRDVRGVKSLFLDYIAPDSAMLASAYAGAEVFVLPSISEIAPNSVIEAALSGTRVVVTENTQACREWFGDKIHYVVPWDIRSIKEGLQASLGAPRASDLMEKARENFTWKATVSKYEQLYRRTIKDRNRG